MHVTEAQKNLFVGLFFALFSLFVIFVVNKHGIAQPSANHVSAAALAPDFFPNMICWLAFAFSLGLIIQGALEMRQGAPETAKQETLDPEEKADQRLAFVCRGIAMAMLFAMYYMTDWLGMIIAGFFFYLAFAILTGERRPVRALFGAAIITVTLYYFFVEIAIVPVPLGPLEFLLYY
jgi:sterol desaturase/sphingolipid hydroxylase (fatty acid hydroxylase superfamily)